MLFGTHLHWSLTLGGEATRNIWLIWNSNWTECPIFDLAGKLIWEVGGPGLTCILYDICKWLAFRPWLSELTPLHSNTNTSHRAARGRSGITFTSAWPEEVLIWGGSPSSQRSLGTLLAPPSCWGLFLSKELNRGWQLHRIVGTVITLQTLFSGYFSSHLLKRVKRIN